MSAVYPLLQYIALAVFPDYCPTWVSHGPDKLHSAMGYLVTYLFMRL